jgi:predicted dinucleotide-binding enzyme
MIYLGNYQNSSCMKHVGIIGSGAVAKAIGSGFIKHGFKVMLSSRDPEKLRDWVNQSGENALTGTFAEAAGFGSIVVLAVLGRAASEALEEAGPDNLKGKTVIDTTNPIAEAPPEDGVLKYTTSLDESLMEQLQHRFPDVNFVKAFNSVGNMFMVNPSFPGGKASMFICGNSDSAKKEVGEILDLFGWETEDMGKAAGARAIEPLCMLWCIPGFLRNEWTHAFKLVKA